MFTVPLPLGVTQFQLTNRSISVSINYFDLRKFEIFNFGLCKS